MKRVHCNFFLMSAEVSISTFPLYFLTIYSLSYFLSEDTRQKTVQPGTNGLCNYFQRPYWPVGCSFHTSLQLFPVNLQPCLTKLLHSPLWIFVKISFLSSSIMSKGWNCLTDEDVSTYFTFRATQGLTEKLEVTSFDDNSWRALQTGHCSFLLHYWKF